MKTAITFPLRADEMPKHWYNLRADFPEPLPPPLHPGTKEPVTPDLMTAMFPESLGMHEMSPERRIEIPPEVQDVYALYRPTPLLRAVRLEKALQTPAHIYYKYEGVSPAGSHKPNTAIPQAYYNKRPAPNGSRPRPARVCGVRRSRLRAASSASSSTSTW